MKKFTESNALSALSKLHNDGYISTKVFCKILAELGLMRKYAVESLSVYVEEEEVQGIEESAQFFEAFTPHPPETPLEDVVASWLEDAAGLCK